MYWGALGYIGLHWVTLGVDLGVQGADGACSGVVVGLDVERDEFDTRVIVIGR